MIEINNLTTVSIDEELLKRVAQKVLEGEKAEGDLSIALVGQGRIRKLNKKYRGKNRVTDVLAFPESKMVLEKFQVNISPKVKTLGEIVICLREVKKNAKRFGTIFEEELAKVLIHGILHLLGYDHEKEAERAKEMREKEEYYFSQINKIL